MNFLPSFITGRSNSDSAKGKLDEPSSYSQVPTTDIESGLKLSKDSPQASTWWSYAPF
jgi:hypothetical protein